MLEEMRSLVVDLERIVVIEQFDVEQLGHTNALYYRRLRRSKTLSPKLRVAA